MNLCPFGARRPGEGSDGTQTSQRHCIEIRT